MKVYQGNGAPTASTYGNVGDYYLDLDTDNMYKCIDIVNHGLDRQFLTFHDSHPDRTEYVWILTYAHAIETVVAKIGPRSFTVIGNRALRTIPFVDIAMDDIIVISISHTVIEVASPTVLTHRSIVLSADGNIIVRGLGWELHNGYNFNSEGVMVTEPGICTLMLRMNVLPPISEITDITIKRIIQRKVPLEYADDTEAVEAVINLQKEAND